jgi:hypothetical protein
MERDRRERERVRERVTEGNHSSDLAALDEPPCQ